MDMPLNLSSKIKVCLTTNLNEAIIITEKSVISIEKNELKYVEDFRV